MLEPFITPAIFQKYPTAIDEWILSTLMAADTASGGLNQLEEHYNTFIICLLLFILHKILLISAAQQTEEDFAQIASAGLSWVRLPIAV